MRSFARGCLNLFVPAVLLVAAQAGAQTRATEEQVRSAFLYQLAQFVVWPSASPQAQDTGISFCVFGNEPLADSLVPVVRGKTIEGREIRVVKASRPEGLASCHVAFIAAANSKQLDEVLAGVKGAAVLLIGEGDAFVERGGMVSFGITAGRVSFTVNLEATRQAGLTMRSQLLRFARLTGQGSPR